ncbi:Rhodanese-like protein [Hyaloscypha variabilis F]|uniref:M-phase inducer phosphatase n=1 Tax=Hyaloscypha variabilis (strain UAMH 11265 / GT02V1 / F) TaxID=1149755 RepID=A0A2J6QYT0_HYAVF|nr:Rhodanese-like protein [Hyaloscypha variabilis F]
MYTSHPHGHLSTGNGFGPGSFDFRDLSMKRSSKPDYFQMKPIRGSSPTASLAADLSQNFHIDMSPQLPTPRRSLFTSNLFGTIDGRECVTTPPLPSSSPGPLNERMDISPLPHKQPYFAQIEVQSPTPGSTPDEIVMPSSPPRPALFEAPKPSHGVERRKSILLRPTLPRTKGFSTNSIPGRNQEQLPPFRFGAGSSKLSTETSMTLGECFMESPPQERRPQSANSPSASIMGPSRPGKPFGSISSLRNGSPIGNHNRRPSNPLIRPRKQFRRSLSMFEHPGDVMKGKNDHPPSNLHTVMDIDELHIPVLPHFFQEGQPDSIPRITKNTLLEILDGSYDNQFDQRMIIDCRFEYEFEGGHIDGAVNYNDKELLASQLFEQSLPGKTLLIFHCEYSAHRAPIMARHVRKQDRSTNAEHYPKLTYPEVYILDGGYSSFFSEHRSRCFPQNYVEMDAKEHAYTCEREMGRLRQTRKLSRAQTFAFGQQGQIDDSPTGPARSKTTGGDLMMTGMTSPLPGPTRRMVSY